MKTRATRLYPFVPSGKDFALALRFFNAIGFETAWSNSGVAALRFGQAYFLLQDVDVVVWQENQMHVVEVDDLEGYWGELSALALEAAYPGAKLRPPTDFPWGREMHLIDPSGVCWHFRQAPEAGQSSG